MVLVSNCAFQVSGMPWTEAPHTTRKEVDSFPIHRQMASPVQPHKDMFVEHALGFRVPRPSEKAIQAVVSRIASDWQTILFVSRAWEFCIRTAVGMWHWEQDV